jgi:hypothetical protein
VVKIYVARNFSIFRAKKLVAVTLCSYKEQQRNSLRSTLSRPQNVTEIMTKIGSVPKTGSHSPVFSRLQLHPAMLLVVSRLIIRIVGANCCSPNLGACNAPLLSGSIPQRLP